MHGFAIALQLDRSMLKLLSSVSMHKPLSNTDLSKKSLWDQYENYSYSELVLISLYKRYLKREISGHHREKKESQDVNIDIINQISRQ